MEHRLFIAKLDGNWQGYLMKTYAYALAGYKECKEMGGHAMILSSLPQHLGETLPKLQEHKDTMGMVQ